MPTYVNKPKTVEAVQWNKIGDHRLVNKCTIDIYKLYYPSPVISDDEINKLIESGLLGTIKIGQGDILVEPSNYIVTEGKDNITVYPEDLFNEIYEIANAISSNFNLSPEKQYYSGSSGGNGFSILWGSIEDCKKKHSFFGIKPARIIDVLIACKEYLINQKEKKHSDVRTKTMLSLVLDLIEEAINILNKNS